MTDEAPRGLEVSDQDELAAELARLREENARLKESAEGAFAVRSRTGRRVGVASLVVIGSLLAALSVPAIWVNRTLMNTDNWVATVAPLADEPAIQNAVSTTVSDAVLKAVNVPGLVAKYLPQQAQPLAAPISGAVEDFVRKQAAAFTRSKLFKDVWIQANRTGHAAVLAAIIPRDGAISNQGGVVSIQLAPIAQAIQARLVAGGLTAAASLPVGSINREIVLFESPMLLKAGVYIDYLQRLAFWFPILGLLAFAGVIILAEDRRRAVLWVGVGTLIATVLPLQGFYLAKIPLLGAIQSLGTANAAAAGVAYDVIFRNLFSAERMVALVAVLFVAGAMLAGPAAFAVALRGAFTGGLSTLSSHFDFGPFGDFVATNKKTLRTVGLIVAALVAVVPSRHVRSLSSILWVVVALLVWLAAVEFFGVEGASPEQTAVDTGSPPDKGEAAV